ncbi:CoA transferase [Reyranella sp. MMS21-HV4-11]|uniref:CoA transferase n=1 Tax=Reyranella humidisoli TaxID=2849149 RepID=A0ABS6IFB0_9HYPH|nr:CoA transferase [Reyranella sp. MMS21-HV4-11]MBU8872432.1 CoA transferase [Reyranella sp. MMS21-HV4-11]
MLPLAGVRVVEFCQVLAGPYCGMLLADLGAEVIKVEPPEGDMMRQWPPITEGYSENFASINRNKRSVVLDLKDPAQKAAARKLILTADVVLENNRPGVMDRLGLGYESFRAERPGLVYCSISAFGQSGPRSGEGGFDVTVQAMSGIMSVTGEPDGAPVKCGVPVSDTGTGLYAAFTIVSVLRRVAGGGAGAHIDASMLGCSLGMAALQTSEFFGTGNDPKKLGSAHPRNAPYQAFKCADGHFVIAAGNNKLWEAVTQVVGRPDLFADPRFATTQSRAANQVALKDLLEVEFAKQGVDHWLAAFEKAGVPQGRINTYSQILADPQVAHMGWVEEMELPSGVKTRTFGSPVRISATDISKRRDPPGLGADTEAIFGNTFERKAAE